jgi:uncharacterized protein
MAQGVPLELVLRRALHEAGIVESWLHQCRRKGCRHAESASDDGLRRCPRCQLKLWLSGQLRPIRTNITELLLDFWLSRTGAAVLRSAQMISLQTVFGKDEQFLDLLEASAEECQVSVQALQHILSPGAKLSLEEFVAARRKGKKVTNEIAERLCKTSVTGLDREDIECIASLLYKIPKAAEKFAERYILFADRLGDVKWDAHLLLMDLATETVLLMVRELRTRFHLERIKDQNETLQLVEGEADELMLASLRALCSDNPDPIAAIILKDLYELLDDVMDRCRDTGKVISTIVLKSY